ncbi:restriction endonuclease subunit S [Corallococcus aberystwythensis]|uniref:Type I restriction modification DNA specificity domain-containing protein n=1 Tax=Corallococcus aberystwythensis TaxID=2316722 RepID=A0A3A8PL13_9BACT|nr:restriction endonuclease subunit S [Corallococcus aberystwythensis]RKH55910.1 hypothetical protein D7W81_35235 [Corallococcus aberystwythensis]
MNENNLPANWIRTALSELGTWSGGGTPSKSNPNFWNGEIPWVSPKDMKAEFIFDAEDYITKTAIEQSATRLVPVESVLVVTRSGILERTLPVATTKKPVAINQDLKSLTPRKGVRARYVALGLKAFEQRILKDCTKSGTTVANVEFASFLRFEIPLAPTSEQDRIIGEVEKQFTRLDAGVEALKRVQAQLKRYRASVLKAACEGRLVPTEAELARREKRDYEPADKLLARIIKERRARWEADQLAKMNAAGKPPKDDKWKTKYVEPAPAVATGLAPLPQGWTWARWEQVGFSQNGRPFPSKDYSESGTKLLRPGNMHVSGRLQWTADNTRHMPEAYATENPDLILRGNEIVINLTAQSLKDEFLGRVCLTDPNERCLLNQRLARLTPVLLSHGFCLWMFKAWAFRRFVDGLNTGSLIQHMFTTQIADFLVALPPLAEQMRIAAEIDRRFSTIDHLEMTADAATRRSSTLRVAILRSAFEGLITPQLDEDEPASRLLERIRATVGNQPVPKQGRSRQTTTVPKMKAVR